MGHRSTLQYSRLCHELALVIHDALYPLCPELRWELQSAGGWTAWSPAPVPPL